MSTILSPQEKGAKVTELGQESAGRSLPGGYECEITMVLPPALYDALHQLMYDTRQDLGEVFDRAIALYKAAVDFKRQGKHVGVAHEDDRLEWEFVGLGSPDSGL